MFQIPQIITAQQAREYALQRRNSPYFWALMLNYFPELRSPKAFSEKFKELLPKIAIHVRKNFPAICASFVEHRDEWDKIFKVICFSDPSIESHEEILMWSHYANHHQGVRLTFRFPTLKTSSFAIKRVTYQKERVAISLFVKDDDEEISKMLYESIFVKNIAWTYEREFRMIVDPDICRKDEGVSKEFFEFEPNWLARVEFGVRCPLEDIDRISSLVRSKFPETTLSKARFHATNFALTHEVL
jgi:hypothetical protein